MFACARHLPLGTKSNPHLTRNCGRLPIASTEGHAYVPAAQLQPASATETKASIIFFLITWARQSLGVNELASACRQQEVLFQSDRLRQCQLQATKLENLGAELVMEAGIQHEARKQVHLCYLAVRKSARIAHRGYSPQKGSLRYAHALSASPPPEGCKSANICFLLTPQCQIARQGPCMTWLSFKPLPCPLDGCANFPGTRRSALHQDFQ